MFTSQISAAIRRFILLMAFLPASVLLAAQKGDSLNGQFRRLGKLDSFLSQAEPKASEKGEDILPVSPDRIIVPAGIDSAASRKFNEAMSAYYEYRINGYSHRSRVFEWQLRSTKITFFVVILLVMAGIFFSGVQFYNSMHRGPKAAATESVTELTASATGIRISSPVLGVIILGLSLLFFYLYLAYVYPIENVF